MSKLAWIAITVSRALCFLIGAAILGYFILAAANREDWFLIFTGLITGGPMIAISFLPSPIKRSTIQNGMKIEITITAHVTNRNGEGVDLTQDELDSFAAQIESNLSGKRFSTDLDPVCLREVEATAEEA